MTVFLDTSAFVALLDEDNADYALARSAWRDLLVQGHDLHTTNYVVLETTAVLHRRTGLRAVSALVITALPACEVAWVPPAVHEAALAGLLVANRRDLSLVDCVSFDYMRRQGITTAFTFDPHFSDQGFEVIPARA
jgi:predicted nucleic acid-binding protein